MGLWYAVLLHAGNFSSAQTGNVMEMAAELVFHGMAESTASRDRIYYFWMRCCCGVSS